MDRLRLDLNIYQTPDALIFVHRLYESYYNVQGTLKSSAKNEGE
jgi:hypothetical protein